MIPKSNPSGNDGTAKAATGLSKARRVTEQQGRRRQADREKRQELARLRNEAGLDQVKQPGIRHKLAGRQRLKGKGLFYCESPAERAKEIQRRLSEADLEDRKGNCP